MRQAATATRVGLILLIGLSLYVAAVLVYQLRFMIDGDYPHLGMRLLFRYHVDAQPEAFGNDYLASYVSAQFEPHLFVWLNHAWLWAGGDVMLLHRLIPIVCWLAFLAGAALAARRLGDRITIVGVVGLAIAQPIYLLQITSAVPHSFGFPLMMWSLAALLYGSAGGLALITVLSGLLYPAVAPLSGLLLAWLLLVERPLWRASGVRPVAGLLLLAVTGTLSLWLVLDATYLRPPSGLGPFLHPGQDAELYPETGAAGRAAPAITSPVSYAAARVYSQFIELFERSKLLLLIVYAGISLYGIVALPEGSTGRRQLLAFLVTTVLAALIILALEPLFVYRFLLYPAFTIMPLLFVVGMQQLCRRLAGVRRSPDVAALGLLALFILTIDSFDRRQLGYFWHLEPETREVMDFAAAQPPGTRFAAWPGRDSDFEWLPYVSRRPLLVSYWLHSPNYASHILAMRARMTALIEAYLATDEAALRDLHCGWQVSYLIVDKAHFEAGGELPSYFAPFDAQIEAIRRETSRDAFLLRAPDPALVALENGRFVVVALPGPCNDDATPKAQSE